MQELSAKELFRKIKKPIFKKRLPYYVFFELTRRCNFRCTHCYILNNKREKAAGSKAVLPRSKTYSGKQKEIDTGGAFSILNQLKDVGCSFVIFTGGEIFTRKDIFDILWYAKIKGFRIILFTNASLIDEKVARELKKLEPDNISISLHAADRMVFEKISGVIGSHNMVSKGLENLRKNNIAFTVKYIQMKENIQELEKVKSVCQKLNAAFKPFYFINPAIDGSRKPLEHAMELPKAYSILRRLESDIFGQKDLEINQKRDMNKLFNCSAGRASLAISPYGELNLCSLINYPNYKILEGSLKEGWNIIKDIVDNALPDENFRCRSCELLEFCSWCPAIGWLQDGRFTTCDPQSRKDAQFRKELLNTH